MDVDALAAGNRPLWRERADAACQASAERTAFRLVAAGSAAGTNADATKLAHFRGLDPPRLVSTYEVRRSQGDDRGAESDVYDTGDWGPRRKAFEQAVGVYQAAVYGTLDLPGCPGDDTYGPYRLSYPPSEDRLTWVLPHNSALVYGANGVFQGEAFRQEVGVWDSRGDIAAVQLGDDAAGRSRDRWPRLLGTPKADDDLVEVVIGSGQVPLAEVTEIRISQQFADQMQARIDEAVDPARHNPLDAPADPHLVLFTTLLKENETGGTPFLVAPETT